MKQLYLDTDDEITAIISKIESIGSETIALIPPKRSTTLQSVVNLKLLKKAAGSVDSKLVIITRDPSILNVASQLKLLTAPNLETEPSVPEPATTAQEMPSATIDGSQPTDADFKSANTAASGVSDSEATDKKSKVSKKKRIPDFDRFKKRILIGLAALLLIGVGIWAYFNLLPAADISVEGRTQVIAADFAMTLDPTAEESDYESALLAAQSRQIQRTVTRSFDATGERTVGERATGQVTVTNCESSESITLSEGTGLTSANGLLFRSTETVTVPGSTATSGFMCAEDGTATVPVVADAIGENYNVGPTSYSVEGYSSENVYGNGGNMTGGSEEQVSVVAEGDIERAQETALEEERESAEEELDRQFSDEDYIIDASFRQSVDTVTADPEVGEEANEGRVILQVTYTLLAVEQEDMEALLEAQYRQQVENAEGLAAIETGIDEVVITSTEEDTVFAVNGEGILGPDLDIDNLKEQLAGEAYQDAIDIIEEKPNVTRVQIDLNPFWASRVPSNPDRIHIEFEVAGLDEDDEDDSSD